MATALCPGNTVPSGSLVFDLFPGIQYFRNRQFWLQNWDNLEDPFLLDYPPI